MSVPIYRYSKDACLQPYTACHIATCLEWSYAASAKKTWITVFHGHSLASRFKVFNFAVFGCAPLACSAVGCSWHNYP